MITGHPFIFPQTDYHAENRHTGETRLIVDINGSHMRIFQKRSTSVTGDWFYPIKTVQPW